MPHTATALADGTISADHVDLLGRANQTWRDAVFADHEETLVEQCRALRFHDARKVVDYWCQRADATASTDRADRYREAAHLNASTTFDGTFVISGTLDPISGAIVDDELVKLERELHLIDERDGVVRTAGQRRAAALVEMATRSATAPADGRRPRPLFTALVGDASLAELCELANGTVLPATELSSWMSDAQLETVLFDGPSTVISVSRRRSFTGAVRRAIEVRDRTCRHRSGCDEPAHRCDVDHIVPYARNGETSQFKRSPRGRPAQSQQRASRSRCRTAPLASRRPTRRAPMSDPVAGAP